VEGEYLPWNDLAMHVQILDHTGEPERTIAAAARLCYSQRKPEDLHEHLDDADVARLIRMVRGLGHLSVFEHASFTFGVSGISRACSHQLVRHRVASYSQQSQRYVNLAESASYVVPPEVSQHGKDDDVEAFFARARELYAELVEAGIPPEDARYVLPQAVQTNIVITMNARELLHFFTLRCCRRAQWEIRLMACLMLKEVQAIAPVVFEKAGPSCVSTGKCSEGTMTCGRPAKSIDEILRELV
jgi:thymidylate synthase (FAD)